MGASVERSNLSQGLPLCLYLSFQSSASDALHDLALEEEEDDQHRYASQHRRRHDLSVADAERGLYCREADRHRHHVVATNHDKGPEEVVP